MNRDSYRQAVEAVWKRNRPAPMVLLLVPWPWSGRMTARHVASHLAAVTEGVSRLEPPAEDAAAVQRHYVEPLMRASRVLTEAAARTPLRARFAEVVVSLDEQMALFADDDDHDFVVTYGLPQWWEPRTETWEPRRRDHGLTP